MFRTRIVLSVPSAAFYQPLLDEGASVPPTLTATYISLTQFASASGDRIIKTSTSHSISEFHAFWSQHGDYQEVQSPQDAPHFAPCEVDPEQHFGRDAIKSMTAIVLDVIDTLDEFPGMATALDVLECAYFCYARFDSAPGNPLFRIIVPLDEPVDAELYESCHLAASLAKKLKVIIDPACQQVDRLYAMPCMPEGFLSSPRFDSPYITIASDDERALSLSDLEPVDDDEVETYLPRQAPAPKVPRPAPHPLFAEMDEYVAQYWGGVEPIFTENACFLYDGIIWKPMSMDALRSYLLNTVFQQQHPPQKVAQFANAMRQRYYREYFPSPAVLGQESSGNERSFRIALTNGTVDPFRSILVPSDPKHYLRGKLPFPFNPSASCPRWLTFLNEIFANDDDRNERIAFVQEMMGYLLIPSTKHQVMFWMYGEGSNGKSVILSVITWLLGNGNVSNVALTKLGQRFYLAQLVGKFANISDEMGANAVLDDEVLKQTISGGRQQAERKGEQPFEFEPHARIVASTNVLPRTIDKSYGFFRRVRILRFTRIFAPHEQDRALPQALRQELPGIFNWALEGLVRLQRNDTFTEVPSSFVALEKYRASVDPVRAFVQQCLRTDTTADSGKPPKSPTLAVYRAFTAYCEEHGYTAPNSSYFGRAMSDLGLAARPSNGRNYYPVALLETEEVEV
jgi:putative DNA primase/helicase